MPTDASSLRDRLRTARTHSRLRRVAAGSLTVALLGFLEGALGASSDALGRAAGHSRTAGSLRTAGRWARGSFLYRWLTAAPDPDVIVIDLRETYTVGPIIALLDRLAGPIGRSYRQSGLRRLGNRLQSFGARVADTRAGRALAGLLAPPEPPETRGDGNADRRPSAQNDATARADGSREDSDDSPR